MSRLVACAWATLALWASVASAQGLARRLAAPRARDEGPRVVLNLTTSLDSDRATITSGGQTPPDPPVDRDPSLRFASRAGERAERCLVPCELALSPGRYRVRFERAGQEVPVELALEPLIVYSRPMNDTELGIGLGLIGVGAVALVVLGVLHQELCLALDGTCPRNGVGYLVLGLGTMSVLIGIGLSIDSMGRVDVVRLPRI